MGSRLAIVGVAATMVFGSTHPSDVAASSCNFHLRYDGWVSIPIPPLFAYPNNFIHDYAVDPVDTNVMFLSNGLMLLRSVDAGCTWHKVFEVPDNLIADSPAGEIEAPSRLSTIQDVAVGAKPGIGRFVYMKLVLAPTYCVARPQTDLAPCTKPVRMLSSTDGGATFVEAPPLEATGSTNLQEIVVAPSDPRIAYVGGVISSGSNGLFVTRDGGRTWAPTETQQQRDERWKTLRPLPENIVQVDPKDPNLMWYLHRGDRRIYESEDGGATWTALTQLPFNPVAFGPVAGYAFAVFRVTGSDKPLIFAASSTQQSPPPNSRFVVSRDGGASWTTYLSPDRRLQFVEVIRGNHPSEIFVSYTGTHAVMYRVDLAEQKVYRVKDSRQGHEHSYSSTSFIDAGGGHLFGLTHDEEWSMEKLHPMQSTAVEDLLTPEIGPCDWEGVPC